MQDLFWRVRRFIEIRDPDLLKEFTALHKEPRLETALWLNEHYPLPDDLRWQDTNMLDVIHLLEKHYPTGRNKHAVN